MASRMPPTKVNVNLDEFKAAARVQVTFNERLGESLHLAVMGVYRKAGVAVRQRARQILPSKGSTPYATGASKKGVRGKTYYRTRDGVIVTKVTVGTMGGRAEEFINYSRREPLRKAWRAERENLLSALSGIVDKQNLGTGMERG